MHSSVAPGVSACPVTSTVYGRDSTYCPIYTPLIAWQDQLGHTQAAASSPGQRWRRYPADVGGLVQLEDAERG